jgi:single-strand DNA-binding protein
MANRRSLNRVILVGNVGRDPEITHIPSLAKDVAKFSMATTEVFMDKKTNQFQDVTDWHNIVAWGWIAKKVERDVHKGSLVLVEGKIKTRKWKDKNDQDRWTTEIAADNVVSLERASRDASYSRDSGVPQSSYDNGPMQPGETGKNDYSSKEPQAPPEMQIDDMPYDESDPF